MLTLHFKPVEKWKRMLLSHLFYHRRAHPESHMSKSIIFLFLQTDSDLLVWLNLEMCTVFLFVCFLVIKIYIF